MQPRPAPPRQTRYPQGTQGLPSLEESYYSHRRIVHGLADNSLKASFGPSRARVVFVLINQASPAVQAVPRIGTWGQDDFVLKMTSYWGPVCGLRHVKTQERLLTPNLRWSQPRIVVWELTLWSVIRPLGPPVGGFVVFDPKGVRRI